MSESNVKHTALNALQICASFANISLDLNAIKNKFALSEAEPSAQELIRIARDNDFKAKIKPLNLDYLKNYKPPFIAIKKDSNEYFVILKIDMRNLQAIIYDGGADVRELSFDELKNLSNEVIILAYKTLNKGVKFGFGWFYKRMLSYKRIVGEVLLASFIMQLFGLVTPLFTQVVLDKVLVHHSISTLNVIAVAFLAVLIFELLLSLSRNYIFAHTTTKINAKLGSELFTHLLLLPMTYFENRKVGNIVARVKELDSIREFIANKSVSVVLDLLFSVVFVIMMLLYSVKLTLIALAFIGSIALIYFFITPILRKRLEDKFQMGAASNSYLVESITGMQTVKSLAIEGSMKKHWEEYLGNYVKSSFNLTNLSNIASGFANALQKV